jgi:hypothetical protein
MHVLQLPVSIGHSRPPCSIPIGRRPCAFPALLDPAVRGRKVVHSFAKARVLVTLQVPGETVGELCASDQLRLTSCQRV